MDGCEGRRRQLSAIKSQGKINFSQRKIREKSGYFIPG